MALAHMPEEPHIETSVHVQTKLTGICYTGSVMLIKQNLLVAASGVVVGLSTACKV